MDIQPVHTPPSRRVVTLPNGRVVGLGGYVAAWRNLKDMDARNLGNLCLVGFYHEPETAAYILRKLREGMHDRINRHLPWWEKGRKWKVDEQHWYAHDAQRLRDIRNRIRVYQFHTDSCRKRFSHLLAKYGD